MSPRATSSVIGVVLLIGIVVITGGVFGVFALDFWDDLNDPAPNVAESSGEFELEPDYPDNQIVRITHIAGEVVAVEEIEIIVRASGPDADLPKETRLIDLPASGSSLNSENIQGDLVEQGSGRDQVIDGDDGVVWSSGDTIQFRIKTGEADFREGESPAADELEVVIVHTPSDTIISEETFSP